MKFPLLLTLSILITHYCNAQDFPNLISPSKITTIGYWSKNQSATYTVTSKSSSFKGKSEKPSKESTCSYNLKLKVIDSTESTYTFQMVYSNFENNDLEIPIARELAKLQENLTILYRTNELGQFDTILNLPELKADLLKKLDESKPLINNTDLDEEMKLVYGMVIDNLVIKLGELESVQAIFAEDIYNIHGFYGMELTLSKTIPIQLQYSTLGNIEMSGTGNITLSSINKSADQCLINETDKPDKGELSQYLETLALLFMIDEGKKLSMEEIQFSMNTKKKITMELSTGWMNKITTTSTVKFTNKKGDRRKVTVSEYKRK